MYFATQLQWIILIKCHKQTKLVAWCGFLVARNDFSDKNRFKSRNPCYFLSKKSVLNRGLCWLKLCYPGTPCTVVFECPLWNSNFERSLAKVMPNATKPKCKGRLGFPLKANINNLHCFAKVFINLLNLHSKVK